LILVHCDSANALGNLQIILTVDSVGQERELLNSEEHQVSVIAVLPIIEKEKSKEKRTETKVEEKTEVAPAAMAGKVWSSAEGKFEHKDVTSAVCHRRVMVDFGTTAWTETR
jgi:hypothetical protein